MEVKNKKSFNKLFALITIILGFFAVIIASVVVVIIHIEQKQI